MNSLSFCIRFESPKDTASAIIKFGHDKHPYVLSILEKSRHAAFVIATTRKF